MKYSVCFCFSAWLVLFSPTTAAGSWVLKNFSVALPPDNGQVTNNLMVDTVSASNGSAQMKSQIKSGYPHEDVGKPFASRASWKVPPTLLKPGQEVAVELVVSPTDVTLSGHWHVYHSVTFTVASSQDGKNWGDGSGLLSTGTSSAGGDPKEGRTRSTWSVPAGKAGQHLALVFLGSPKFRVAYEYQWEDKEGAAATLPSAGAREPEKSKASADSSGRKDSGARFTELAGQVEVLREGETEWRFAKRDMVIYYGDMVKTGEDSVAVLGFSDMSVFRMRPESQIYVPEPTEQSKLKLVIGNIWINVRKMIKDGSMEIETNQAAASVKGTRFELADNGTASAIRVESGLVAFRPKGGKASVEVGPGQVFTASRSGLQQGDTHGLFRQKTELSGNSSDYSSSPPIESDPQAMPIRFTRSRELKMHASLMDSFKDVINQIEDPGRKTFVPVAIWREKGLGRGSSYLVGKKSPSPSAECLEFAVAYVTDDKPPLYGDFARMLCRSGAAEGYVLRQDAPVSIEPRRLTTARGFVPPSELRAGDVWRIENSEKLTAHSSAAAMLIGLNVDSSALPVTKLWESSRDRGAVHVSADEKPGCRKVVLKQELPVSGKPPFNAEFCPVKQGGQRLSEAWQRGEAQALPPEEVSAALKQLDHALRRATEAKWWGGVVE